MYIALQKDMDPNIGESFAEIAFSFRFVAKPSLPRSDSLLLLHSDFQVFSLGISLFCFCTPLLAIYQILHF